MRAGAGASSGSHDASSKRRARHCSGSGMSLNRVAEERLATGMAWAIHQESGEADYVGKLGPAAVGLRCRCVCPACGVPLEAVRVAPTTTPWHRAPFFRHHGARQEPGCRSRVAEMAALKLLTERGLIRIPPPRKSAVYPGLSGRLYPGEQVGEAIEEAIVERRAVSAVHAVLTLDSGRTVALILRGHQDVGILGTVDAVIEIQVDDAEVSLLAPEEILRRVELQDKWLHVRKHPDDDRLQRLADEDARAKALERLDIQPGDLNLPIGATRKQTAESILHWAVKDALSSLGSLVAPEFRDTAVARGRDGQLHTVEVCLPGATLSVDAVRDEVLFDGYRPDIVCQASSSAEGLGTFELLLEVAVTHKVTQDKLAKIKGDRRACIELDVGRFAAGGEVTRSELRELVATDLSCKTWLHHPAITERLAQAQRKANDARDLADSRRAAAERAAARARRQLEDRQRAERAALERKTSWARGLDQETALREFRVLLERRWIDKRPVTSNGMRWEEGEFEEAISRAVPAAASIKELGSPSGLARRLSYLLRVAASRGAPLDYLRLTAASPGQSSWQLDSWLGLLHLVIEHLGLQVHPHQAAEYAERHRAILASLREGVSTYCREGHLDAHLKAMFPELLPVFDMELSTRPYGERIRKERQQARADAKAAADAAALAAAEAAKAEAKRLKEEAAAREKAERLASEIQAVGMRWKWRPNGSRDLAEALKTLPLYGIRNPDAAAVQLVQDALAARDRAEDFAAWFTSRTHTDLAALNSAREVLEAAYLISLPQSPPAASRRR